MTAGLVAHHPRVGVTDGSPSRADRVDADRVALARLVAGLQTIDAELDALLPASERGTELAPTEVAAVVELALGAAMRRLDAEADLERARTHLVTAGALPAVAMLLELVGADRGIVRRATGGALTSPEGLREITDDRVSEIAHQLGWREGIDRREPELGFDGFWEESTADSAMLQRLRRWAGRGPGT